MTGDIRYTRPVWSTTRSTIRRCLPTARRSTSSRPGGSTRSTPVASSPAGSTCSLAGPWESLGSVPLPEWTRTKDVEHLWAPHVVEADGTFHLYYAASSFGTNRSAIGLATTTTPGDLESWVDPGPILTSQRGDDYNAIDPQVFLDGRDWYFVYGSFWTGIQMQPLADDMSSPGETRLSLARNPSTRRTRSRTCSSSSTANTGISPVSWTSSAAGLPAPTGAPSDIGESSPSLRRW